MRVITFQNYTVAREINETGLFKSNVRREWIEGKHADNIVKHLVSVYNKTMQHKMEKPVFCITRINVEVSSFGENPKK